MSEWKPPADAKPVDTSWTPPSDAVVVDQAPQQPVAPAVPGKPPAPSAPMGSPSTSVAGSSPAGSGAGPLDNIQPPIEQVQQAGSGAPIFTPGTESFATKSPLLPSQKPDAASTVTKRVVDTERLASDQFRQYAVPKMKTVQETDKAVIAETLSAQDEVNKEASYYLSNFADLDQKALDKRKAETEKAASATEFMVKEFNSSQQRLQQQQDQLMQRRSMLESMAGKDQPILDSQGRVMDVISYKQLEDQYNADARAFSREYTAMGIEADLLKGLAKNAEMDEKAIIRREFDIKAGIGNRPAGVAYSILNQVGSGLAGSLELIGKVVPTDREILEYVGVAKPGSGAASRKSWNNYLEDVESAPVRLTGVDQVVTPEYIQNLKNNSVFDEGLFALAEMTPAIAASIVGGTPAMAATYFSSSYRDTGKEMQGELWDQVPEAEKEAIRIGVATVSAGLSTMGFQALAGRIPIVNDIFFKAAKKMLPGMTPGAIRRIIDAETKSYVANLASKGVQGFVLEGLEESADFTSEEIVKTLYENYKSTEFGEESNKLFNNSNSFKEYAMGLWDSFRVGGIAGSMLGGSMAALSNIGVRKRFSDKEFEMFKNIVDDGSLKQDFESVLAADLESGKINRSDYDKMLEDLKTAKGIVDQIPEDLSLKATREAYDLLEQKAKLKKKDKALVGDKIAAIDAKLMKLAGVEPEVKSGATVTPAKPTATTEATRKESGVISENRASLEDRAKGLGYPSLRSFNSQTNLSENLTEEETALRNDYALHTSSVMALNNPDDIVALSDEDFGSWAKANDVVRNDMGHVIKEDDIDAAKLRIQVLRDRGLDKQADRESSLLAESRKKDDWTLDSWIDRFGDEDNPTQRDVDEANQEAASFNAKLPKPALTATQDRDSASPRISWGANVVLGRDRNGDLITQWEESNASKNPSTGKYKSENVEVEIEQYKDGYSVIVAPSIGDGKFLVNKGASKDGFATAQEAEDHALRMIESIENRKKPQAAQPVLEEGQVTPTTEPTAKGPVSPVDEEMTVKSFAESIASGNRLDTPEAVQFYENNKKEIEAELRRMAGPQKQAPQQAPVDPNDDAEVTLDEEVADDPDALLEEAMGTPLTDEEIDAEMANIAKSVGGTDTDVIDLDQDGYAKAVKDASGDTSNSMSEGFFIGKDRDGKRRIYINRDMFRRGLMAHEGTHAIIFAALSKDPKAKKIISNSAKQALGASPGAKKVLLKFLENYGGAKTKADGSVDVDATVADPELGEEVMSEFVASIYNGTIKLDSATRQFIRDLYNRIMAALGVSTKVEFKEDGDFIAAAKQIASAMKAGRKIKTASNMNPLADPDLAPGPIRYSNSITNSRKVKVSDKGHSLSFVKKSDIIDFAALVKDIADKKQNVWFWAADQLGRGMYADEISGNTHFLDAGPSYALDPKNRSKGIIWASGLAENTLRSSAEKADYIFIVSGSPQRSKLFNKAVIVALKDRVEAKSKLSWGEFAEKVMGMTEVANINKVLSKYPSFQQLLDSGADRKVLFKALIDQSNLKATKLSKYFKEIGLSLEVDSMRDGFYVDNDFGINDVMLVLKPSTAGGKSSHGTYGTNVYGEVVGVPDIVVNGVDLLPEDPSKTRSRVSPMGASSGSLKSQIPSGIKFSKRQPDGSLNGLPRKFKVGGKEMEASHWQPAEDVAISYMKKAGLSYNPPSDYVKADPARAKRIADAYEAMKHDPENPEVKEAYEALAKETIAQYEEVLGSGLKVEFIPPGSPDPYAASPRLATEDIRNNNHMWVFGTRDGFGSSDFDPSSNPLLEESGFEISGQPALVNDLFRVVHDYFGHVKEGVGFRADGEENAWRMHSSMFSPKAQRALTTETRGQNSWVNFGPQGEKNRTASGSDTVYADQKTGLLPMWVSEDGRNDSIEEADKPKFSKATPGKNVVPTKHRQNLTDDGKGNYVFFHKGPKNLKGGKIDPSYFGSGKTKDNRSNPVMNYYTKPDHGERMISGDITYAVPVPKWKVYPLMSDPLDLYDKAEANFRKKFGKDQAFDAVRQADFIGPLAEKAGFDIMIAGWSVHPLRAESGKALKPDMALTKKYEDEGVVDLTAPGAYERMMAKARGDVKFSGASPENIAKALIAKGYNTKAKAREYMVSKGADRMVDQVMAEFDKLRDAANARKASAQVTPTPPATPTPPPTTRQDGGGRPMRGSAKRMKEQYPELYAALGEDTIYYDRMPMTVTRDAASELVGWLGLERAKDEVLNRSSDIPDAVRAMMGRMVMKQLADEHRLAELDTFAENFFKLGTSAGQFINALRDVYEEFSKDMIFYRIQRIVEKEVEKKKGKDKNYKKLRDGLTKVNKEVAEEVIRTRKVRDKATDASFPKPDPSKKPKTTPAYGTKNKVVKKSQYDQAWRELSSMLPSGVAIPQLVTIATYHIEAGSRSFADVAERVIAKGGRKLLPYLKGSYKQAAKDMGIEPSTDAEIDEYINKANTEKIVDKLRKAIKAKDKKSEAAAIAALQQVAKDDGLWGKYRKEAVSRLTRLADQDIKDDIQKDTIIAEFTAGLVRNITDQMKKEAEAKGLESKEPKTPKSAIEIIGDAYRNFDKYEQVWKDTQSEWKRRLNAAEARLAKATTLEAKQKAQADIVNEQSRLDRLDAYYGELMIKPFSEAAIGRAVKDGMKELDQKIDNIIRQHYTVYEAAKQTLADKLVQGAGLTEVEAAKLADAVKAEFERLATERKKALVEQYAKRKFGDKKVTKTEKKGIEDELIFLTNTGAFGEADFINKYGELRGWPKLTDKNIKEIERLADRIQTAPPGRPRLEAIEDLLGYQENLSGVSKWEVAQSVWFANMLSGFETQEVNFLSNQINLAMEVGVAVSKSTVKGKPMDAVNIVRALGYGFARGWYEAGAVMSTGYSPIRGRVDIPPALERYKFPKYLGMYNGLKMVRRVMVAADVLGFEPLKELRAYQYAAMKARSVDPSPIDRQRALDILNRDDDTIAGAKQQAEDEYQADLKAIEERNLTAAEKRKAITKAERDKNRRAFELVELARDPEVIQESARFAARATFNYTPEGALGAVAKGVNMILRELPALRYVVPFVNIIANVTNEALNYYAPVGIARAIAGGSVADTIMGRANKGMTEDQKKMQREDLVSKAVIGLVLQAAVLVLSDPGDDDDPLIEITANGYNNYKQNSEMESKGLWKPYSFRFRGTDTWISYQYTPLLFAFGLVGHLRDATKYRKEKMDDSTMTKYAVAMQRNIGTITDASFLATTADALGWLNDTKEGGLDGLARSTAKTVKAMVVPYSALLNQIQQNMDSAFGVPKMDARGSLTAELIKNTPVAYFVRDKFPIMVDALGDPIIPSSGALRRFATTSDPDPSLLQKLFISAPAPDRFWRLMVDKKYPLSAPNPKTVTVYDDEAEKERILTEDELFKFYQLRGSMIKMELNDRFDELSTLDNKEFAEEMMAIQSYATTEAKWEATEME